jgi:uncharacterized protein YcaQ
VPNTPGEDAVSFWKLTDITEFGQIKTEVFGGGSATTERSYFDLTGRAQSISTDASGARVEDLAYAYYDVPVSRLPLISLLSRDLKDDRPVEAERHAWWGQGPLRLMMDMLAGRGEIAVAGRAGTHRVWDLPERVWPETERLSWRDAERELEERRRRRLGAWLQGGEWHAHPESSDEPVGDRVTLLSPFDGLVKDRDRAEALWGFRYRLEMYVPKTKREYGYYVLPLLVGDLVVGRAEPRFDRKTGKLELLGAWGDTSRLDEALDSVAEFLGATR